MMSRRLGPRSAVVLQCLACLQDGVGRDGFAVQQNGTVIDAIVPFRLRGMRIPRDVEREHRLARGVAGNTIRVAKPAIHDRMCPYRDIVSYCVSRFVIGLRVR
jgi:hypothetical protein